MSDGMTDLERLVAKDEIRTLKARRDRALDTKDWDTFIATHWPDHISAIDEHGTRPLTEAVEDLKIMLDGVDTTHHSHSPEITFTSPTEAVGVWAMEDMLYWHQKDGPKTTHGYGYYHETYAKRDGEWRTVRRWLQRTHVHTTPGGVISDLSLRAPRPE